MFTVLGEQVFPFLRTLGERGSTYAHHMKDARFTIPTPALLAKVVDLSACGTARFLVAAGEYADRTLSANQIEFVDLTINHLTEHGRHARGVTCFVTVAWSAFRQPDSLAPRDRLDDLVHLLAGAHFHH